MGHEASHLPSMTTTTINSHNSYRSRNKSALSPTPSINSYASRTYTKSAVSPMSSMPIKYDAYAMSSITDSKTETVEIFSKKKIQNGVTGDYVSLALVETAYVFWKKNIDRLSRSEQLEIGCAIYFTMMSTRKDMKKILWNHAKADPGNARVKQLGLQFLDMISWLIRHLLMDDINLKTTLTQLGLRHKAIGIEASHFAAMLSSVHETFAYYFEHKYSIKEKYAIDKLFTVAAELMMDAEDIHTVTMMDDVSKSFDNLDFLKSVSVCLKCDVGKAYLYRYFQQTFCDELVIYLQSILRYKAATSDKERFMIARDICKTSIEATAAFALNLSYETRMETIAEMQKLDAEFFSCSNGKQFKVRCELFDNCQRETVQLIQRNHWKNFQTKIKMLRYIS